MNSINTQPNNLCIQNITQEEFDKYSLYSHYSKYSTFEDLNPKCFNCMGYVLDMYCWLHPVGSDNESINEILKEIHREDLINNVEVCVSIQKSMELCDYTNPYLYLLLISRLLNRFPQLRIIETFRELNSDEYGISFSGGNGDFHFIRYQDGRFSHKIADESITFIKSEKEGFFPRYDGKIIRFAMKKGKKLFNPFNLTRL
ncbi:MAG: hypothetical protein ACI4WH_04655 [Oscillospiraceae bacterium]